MPTGSPWPEGFPSIPGAVFPVFHLFADLAGFDRIYPTFSSHPLQVEGLTLIDAQNRRRILVANLTGETQELKIKSGTGRARVRMLDETNAEEAMRSPETFGVNAFAYARGLAQVARRRRSSAAGPRRPLPAGAAKRISASGIRRRGAGSAPPVRRAGRSPRRQGIPG